MPHLRIRNVDEQCLKGISTSLADRLVEVIGCERSWITLDLESSVQIQDGQRVNGNPFVEVLWFSRPEPIRTAVAAAVSEALKGEAEYVTVVFRDLDPSHYYENDQNFS